MKWFWMMVVAVVVMPVLAWGAGDRPNIVLFIADDLSWHDCGAYGATDVKTPNIDRLAKEGMTVERAFAASPTCSPSRSAIYTGLMPMRNGAHSNHTLIKEGVQTLPEYMEALGYRVVIAGKTHIGPREQFPFEYLANSNIMPPGKHAVLWTDLNTKAVEGLLANDDKSKPLCLVVCPHSPHVYWMDNQGYDAAKVTLPPMLVDTAVTRDARCRYYTDVSHMDEQLGAVWDSLKKHGYDQGDGKLLFVFTADQGAQWPFGKWNLYDEGVRAPLIVRWIGKVKEGSKTEAMVSLVDLLPTFMEAASGEAPADLDGKSLMDVLMGKKDSFRTEVYATHTGDKEMNRTPMRSVRTEKYEYILNLKPETKYTTHISEAGLLDGRDYWDSWVKLAETDAHAAAVIQRYRWRPAEELYDVKADPFEMKNLASEPEMQGVLKELREKVKAWRLQQGEDLNKVLMPEDGRIGPLKYAG